MALLAAPAAPAQVAEPVEILIKRQIQILESAFINRDLKALKPLLDKEFKIADQQGETALLVLKAAMDQLPQLEAIRVKAIQPEPSAYRVTVDVLMYGLAVERDVVLTLSYRILEMNLFQVQFHILIGWEPLTAPPPKVIADRFRLASNLVLIENVRINGVTGCMILDTGTSTMLLNGPRLDPASNRRTAYDGSLGGAGGTTRAVERLWVSEFAWQGLQMGRFETIAMDLTHLENQLRCPILGIIGYRTIRQYDLTIDYDLREVTLCRLETDGERIDARRCPTDAAVLPFELAGPLPVIPVTIGGTPLRFGVDTGATANVIDRSVDSQLAAAHYRELDRSYYVGVDNQSRSTRRLQLNRTRVGPADFDGMVAVVGDLSHLRRDFGIRLDGLLGYEFLSRRPMTFNFIKQELWIGTGTLASATRGGLPIPNAELQPTATR
jgi:predicted aspartyl protease